MNVADMAYLKEGVTKATEKVAKCKATIVRHEQQLQKKIATLTKLGITLANMEEKKWKGGKQGTGGSEHYWEIVEVESKQDDIKGATKKLKEAEEILANWTAKLGKEIEKDRFIAGNAPKVIVEFLERWKKLAFEWHVKRYDAYLKFKDKLVADELVACLTFIETEPGYEQYLVNGKLPKDKRNWNFYHNYCNPRKPLEAYLKEQKLDWQSIKARERSFAGVAVLRMYEFRDEKARLAWLEKELEAEKKAKMVDLINRVNAVIGSIEDASLLNIDPMGNLNGIVAGKKEKAKVETISAGGWNIQCFHYRVLVHKLDQKKAK